MRNLQPRLELGINRALVSRLGFCLRLERWSAEALGDYLQQRLAEVGIHSQPLRAAGRNPAPAIGPRRPAHRQSLLLRAMEQAALASRRNVTQADVQQALDALPWLARLRAAT